MDYTGNGTRVVMGPGAIGRVADEVRRLDASRVMLITGGKTAKTALTAQVTAALGPLLVELVDSVVEHSTTSIVEEAAERAAAAGVDLLLAVGGGSSSDTAKAVAILLAEGAPLARHANRFTPPDQLVQQQLDEPKLPLLAIPTTASAAEVTPALAIRTDEGRKLLFWDMKVAARTVILDPLANLEVPVALMATSGMNALALCIEGLYAKGRNPIAEGLALQGLRLLAEGLTAMAQAPQNAAARAQVLYGAHLSGMTISSTRTCIHHAICHCLGALGGLSHGVANSIILPHAMRFNVRVAAPQLKLAAWALGVDTSGVPDLDAAELAVDAMVRLQRSIGVPSRLSDTSLRRDQLLPIAEFAMNDRAVYFNPGPLVTPQEILQILESAW